jgi:hypothetical protein
MRFVMVAVGVICFAVGIIGRGEVPGFFYVGAIFLATGLATIDIVSSMKCNHQSHSGESDTK